MTYPPHAEAGIATQIVVLFNGVMSRDILIAVAIVAADLLLLRVYGRRPRGLSPVGRGDPRWVRPSRAGAAQGRRVTSDLSGRWMVYSSRSGLHHRLERSLGAVHRLLDDLRAPHEAERDRQAREAREEP
jgi:hypothetical protein